MTLAPTTPRILTWTLLLLLLGAVAVASSVCGGGCAEETHELHGAVPRLLGRLVRRLVPHAVLPAAALAAVVGPVAAAPAGPLPPLAAPSLPLLI